MFMFCLHPENHSEVAFVSSSHIEAENGSPTKQQDLSKNETKTLYKQMAKLCCRLPGLLQAYK